MGLGNIDTWRKGHLAIAEWIDAWRLIPRALVGGYVFLLYKVINWYMDLEPHLIPNCISDNAVDCIVQAPSTQHAALVTAVVGISAAVFGLYTTSGKKWNGFTPWNKSDNGDGDSTASTEKTKPQTLTPKTVYVVGDEGEGG